MNTLVYPLIAGVVLSVVTTQALAQIAPGQAQPSRAEMVQPAPNTSWNLFNLNGFDTEEIAPGLYTFRYGYTRNIFMVTDDGVIATDPISPEAAKVYRAEIAKVTDQPVKYVIYSHEHWDHAPGGQIFKDEGATFISHENCKAHFEDLPNPNIVMPDITFSGNYTLELGGRKLDLLYFGPNHGDCLVVMRPDPGNVLFIVDIVVPGAIPLAGMADNSLHHWMRTLRELEAMEDWETMIPGHAGPLAHRSAVTERREYVETLMASVKAEFDGGTSVFEIPSKVRPTEFSYLRWYDTNIQSNVDRVLTYYFMGW
jgi:glyoxylase-like metal-dependent hydrolase (beta-lactamase superfamily II)